MLTAVNSECSLSEEGLSLLKIIQISLPVTL